MKPFRSYDRALCQLPLRKRPRRPGFLGVVLVIASALLLCFLALPYVTLWRIEQAVRDGDAATLADLVDLESVRAEIKKKLNKDTDSAIGELSDSFILWLEKGIGVEGNQAVDQLVTLSWVRERLLEHSAGDGREGFLGQVTFAFFDRANGFVVRIGPSSETPVQLRLSLRGLSWRISAVYY